MNSTKSLYVLPLLIVGLGLSVNAGQVTVSSNPLWTDTGIVLTNPVVLTITASASWNWGQAAGPFGPDGDTNCVGCTWNTFFSGANCGALIAFVGPDPYQGEWGNGTFFPQTNGYWNIGSSNQFVCNSTGELWLGFNDDAVSPVTGDNVGSATAQISLSGTNALQIPGIFLLKAVRPSFTNLTLTANYQLQVSSDLITWTNQGAAFTAANVNMVYPQYFDVDDWGQLFFRLRINP